MFTWRNHTVKGNSKKKKKKKCEKGASLPLMRSSLEGFFLEAEQGQKQRLFLGVGRSLSNEPRSVKISPGCRVARMCLQRATDMDGRTAF